VGARRNAGISEIRGVYTVFLDDDSFMNCGIVENLMAQMEELPDVDMALSSYRIFQYGKSKPDLDTDHLIMKQSLQDLPSRVVALDGNEDLLRLTDFSWTKLYRSTFIRRIKLRFSETAMKNDVYAHWQSLLGASRILLSNLVQCTKIASSPGERIRNISDHQLQLQAFAALRETCELVHASGRPGVEAVFWQFYRDLARWMLQVAPPASRPLLMCHHISFAGAMPPEIGCFDNGFSFRRWEIWEMKYIADDMLPADATGSSPHPSLEHWKLCLLEISRLKNLAVELRTDNDCLHTELDRG